jgi:hypothetical protein
LAAFFLAFGGFGLGVEVAVGVAAGRGCGRAVATGDALGVAVAVTRATCGDVFFCGADENGHSTNRIPATAMVAGSPSHHVRG